MTLQRSLGHAKATTTLNTYAHLWATAEDRTRKAAKSIMCASLSEPTAPAPLPSSMQAKVSGPPSDRSSSSQGPFAYGAAARQAQT